MLAPALTRASTPGEPSAFIRTTDHDPESVSHVSTCVPVPCADATQNVCDAGGLGVCVPGCRS